MTAINRLPAITPKPGIAKPKRSDARQKADTSSTPPQSTVPSLEQQLQTLAENTPPEQLHSKVVQAIVQQQFGDRTWKNKDYATAVEKVLNATADSPQYRGLA